MNITLCNSIPMHFQNFVLRKSLKLKIEKCNFVNGILKYLELFLRYKLTDYSFRKSI
jgi:hypothetical protein